MNRNHHSVRGDAHGTTLQDRPGGDDGGEDRPGPVRSDRSGGGVCDRWHCFDLTKVLLADPEVVRPEWWYIEPCEGYSVPCDRPPDDPLTAAEEEVEEKIARTAAASDILAEQADAIVSAEQESTRCTAAAQAMSTMRPLVDRGDISSVAVQDVLLAAVNTCTRCGEHPPQIENPFKTRMWATSTGIICRTCLQRSMGYVSRTAASIHPEEVEWYYDGRVPLGALTLLVGPPGLGKTTFACELAARGTRGELDGAAADVIFATTEDSLAHTLVPRFTAADADRDRVHFMKILEADVEVGLTLPDHLPRLQDLVEDTGANLIVLDPVVGHLSGNIDSHKDHSVRRALAPLAALAETTGCAILGIMHLNKSSSTDVLTRVAGSVAFGAAARSVLLLHSDPNAVEGASDRLLIHGKTNLGPLAVAVRLRVEGRTITTVGGEIETSGIAWLGDDLGATAAKVLAGRQEPSRVDAATGFLREVLAEGPLPSVEVKALAVDEDITEQTLKRAKKELGIESKKKGFGPGSAVHWSLPTTPEFRILGQL